MGQYDLYQDMRHGYDSRNVCLKCGATVITGDQRAKHSRWHHEIEKGIQVSNVKWCDMGNHAFKAGAPGSQSMELTQTDENGIPVLVDMDICGEHAFPTATTDPTRRAVEAAYDATKAE